MNKRFLFIHCIVFMVLTGCATVEMKRTETGFLSDYSGLEEDEESKGMYIYTNPNANIAQGYSKVIIAPVEFKLDPSVEAHQMKGEDRQKLTDYFYKELEDGLKENYTITTEAGEGVLLLRTAVTDVLPNKVYLNLHWSTTLIGAGIGGASLEAELVDSLTGERVLAFIDARKGKKLNYTKGLTKWGHTKEVLGIWANIMVMHLERLRGVPQEESL
ncbi:MAG TPA: DUF3313 domain-containing protein [Candidatus Omnitrophota bacterium]|nr:DUF3313 domain-containing protein [Candidatus Omnitrophota bacterium]